MVMLIMVRLVFGLVCVCYRKGVLAVIVVGVAGIKVASVGCTSGASDRMQELWDAKKVDLFPRTIHYYIGIKKVSGDVTAGDTSRKSRGRKRGAGDGSWCRR